MRARRRRRARGAVLSGYMKGLNEKRAMCYRRVTGRVGRVFRRPFWSEPVEAGGRSLVTMRYIRASRFCEVSAAPQVVPHVFASL